MNKDKTKVCKGCKQKLPINDFYFSPLSKDCRTSLCKKCYQERQRRYKKEIESKERIPKQYKKHKIKNISLWTQSAIDCILRQCKCKGCIMEDLASKCQMKNAVLDLVKKYGVPNEYKEIDKNMILM